MSSMLDRSPTQAPPGPASEPGSTAALTGTARTSRALASAHPVAAATLAGSLCLLLHATAYAIGWADHFQVALTLWYVGFVLLAVPFAWLLLSPRSGPHQRLLGSVSFTLLLHLSWLLSSPVLAIRFDETLHVTTLRMLTEGDGWFAPNTMLPVSPHYPGLELAAGGVHWLTGLPLVVCQIVVVLIARVTLVVALFLLASRIAKSPRAGGIAVLLYAASAQFYFFNAQFSYQTVAIAMLMAAIYLLLRACDSAERRPWKLLLGVQACLAALAVTHHLTSWLTLATLWGLAALFAAGGERRRASLVLVTAEIATVVMAAWTALIAPLLVDYLTPIFGQAGDELERLLMLDTGGNRELLGGAATPTPFWEVAVMGAASLLWCLLLLPAAWAALRGTSINRSSGRLLPLLLAGAYPALLLARFSPRAAEIADRAGTFVSMAMALVIAAWAAPRLAGLGRTGLRVAVAVAVTLILGGVILGNGPDWQRVPGRYLPAAEQRSVDAETIAVGQWAGRYLPTGARIASDSTMNRVLPNFADVVPVTGSAGSANVTPLFIYDEVGDVGVELIQDAEIDFVVVDTRMIGEEPLSGSFFEGSNDYGPAAMSLTERQLGKFEGTDGFDLVLDGPVQVFDVRGLRGEPAEYADRPAPGLPGDWNRLQVAFGILVLAGLVVWRRSSGLGPPRWRPRREWGLATMLPALMGFGGMGVLTGFAPWLGSVLLVGAVAALVYRARRRGPAAEGSRGRSAPTALRLAIAAVVVLAVLVATVAAWRTQLGHDPLPPPSVSDVDSGAGASG